MRALVVAKAPVPGRVKTRLGAHVGMEAAAEARGCRAARHPRRLSLPPSRERHLALDGDLADAVRSDALRRSLAGWTVHRQRGAGLGERLAHAHADAAGPGPAVQVGMDTPQATPDRPARGGRGGRPTQTPCSAPRPTAAGGCWPSAMRRRRRCWPAYRCRGATPSTPPAAPWSRPGTTVRVGPRAHRRRHRRRRRAQVARHQVRPGGGLPDRRPLPPGVADGDGMTVLPLASVFAHALRGQPCTVCGGRPGPAAAALARVARRCRRRRPRPARPLPRPDPRHRLRPRPDVGGAGPAGHAVLGIDVVPEAVRQTRDPRGAGAAPRRLRRGARRGPLAHRAARRRQHRHRRRPGGAARARPRPGRPARPGRRGRRPVGAPASSPATSCSRPPTAGAGSSPGPPSEPTPSRRWPPRPGWRRAKEHRYGDRRWAVIGAGP